MIIPDVNFPGSSHDLCRRVPRNKVTILILMLASLASLDDKTEEYDPGVDDLIVNPFEYKEHLHIQSYSNTILICD